MLTGFETVDQPDWNPVFMAAGIGILLGLILKFAAIFPALAAEQSARAQTWYEPSDAPLSAGRALMVRMGLNLGGLVLIITAISGSAPAWLWPCLSLACLAAGEVVGRRRFYKAYRRLGL